MTRRHHGQVQPVVEGIVKQMRWLVESSVPLKMGRGNAGMEATLVADAPLDDRSSVKMKMNLTKELSSPYHGNP